MSTIAVEFKKHYTTLSWIDIPEIGIPKGQIQISTEDPLSSTTEARDQAELNLHRLRQIINYLAMTDSYCVVIDNREPGK